MLYFRRRRYQYVWASIGRAYYGSLPRQSPGRHPENDSLNATNINPTSPSTKSSAQVNEGDAKVPSQELIRTTPPPIDISQKIEKPPRGYLNLTSLLPPEGQLREHGGPRNIRDSPIDMRTSLTTARRTTSSKTLRPPLRGYKHKRRVRRSRSFLGPVRAIPAMYKTDREGLAQRYTAYRPGAATPAVDDETDGKRLAQQAMDYGPAFAPYTTKLLKRTEGWESRPALWDISPGLNRPIVVLSVDVSGPEDAIVTFMNIRSFKSVGAKTSPPNFWKKHLPLSRLPRENWRDDPEARDSWKDALLFRENYMGREINRMQYVDIQHISTARWEDLRCYRGGRRIIGARQRVCENSMAQLRAARTWWEGHRNMGRGLVNWEDEWVPTGELRDVFRRRYIEPLGKEDNELGSVVAGRASNDASEGIGELVLQMEGLRAEMRAEFEETRNKMRAGLHKVKTETRSKLMTRMIEELEDSREGGRGVGTGKEREAADAAAGVRDVSAVGGLASSERPNKVEAMRLMLKMARIEVDGVRAEMERMRGDMDKMKVDVALLKRADAAREAAWRRKRVKVQKAGMYVPVLGPRSSAARAELPPWVTSDVLEGAGESTLKGLKEELKQAMSDPEEAAQTPTPAASLPPQVAGKVPILGPLAQSRG
ncbi:hypothetical protein VF21_07420 [Pseudogymnoascus sp. 05NY08]|nr:hypothetical protein VF21_07420 [Pseudogymnoascus sp. 05NY08]